MLIQYRSFLTVKNVSLALSIIVNIGLILVYLLVTSSYKQQIERLETNLVTCQSNTAKLEQSITMRNDEIDRANIETIEKMGTINEVLERFDQEKQAADERIQRILNLNRGDSTCESAMELMRQEALNR